MQQGIAGAFQAKDMKPTPRNQPEGAQDSGTAREIPRPVLRGEFGDT